MTEFFHLVAAIVTFVAAIDFDVLCGNVDPAPTPEEDAAYEAHLQEIWEAATMD